MKRADLQLLRKEHSQLQARTRTSSCETWWPKHDLPLTTEEQTTRQASPTAVIKTKSRMPEKTVEVTQMHDADKIVDVQLQEVNPWPMQRQVPKLQTAQKTVEALQEQYSVRIVDEPLIREHQVLTIQKTTQVPRGQIIEKAVQKSMSELDECEKKATEIRQKKHTEFVTLIVNSADATELTKLAVIKSNKLHAPKSHKEAPKVELSSEDSVYVNVGDETIS